MRGPPSARRSPIVSLHMTDLDVVRRAAKLIGGQRTIYTVQPKKREWKVSYRIQVKGLAAGQLMRLLRPLMGQRRREQIRAALQSLQLPLLPPANKNLSITAAKVRRLCCDGVALAEIARRFDCSVRTVYRRLGLD